MQEVLIAILFLGSAYFVGRKLYLEFKAKEGCAQGCAKCSLPGPEVLDPIAESAIPS